MNVMLRQLGTARTIRLFIVTEEERESFLAAFIAEDSSHGEGQETQGYRKDQAANKKAFVGFAVMGGIFSEGVDLVGDRLTGVVVVVGFRKSALNARL